MLTFLFIAGRPDAVRAAFPRLADAAQSASTFGDGVLRTYLASTGLWAVAAYSGPDPLANQRIVFAQHGAIAINGPLFACGSKTGQAAIEAALEVLKQGGADDLYERLRGTYSLASFTSRNGLLAFPDFSGIFPIYAREFDGFCAVSNRISALAALSVQRRWDLQSLSWLIGHANIFGVPTPAWGVDLIKPGTFACAMASGRFTFQRFRKEIWPAPESDHRGRDNLSDAEWEEVTEDLRDNARASVSAASPVRLGLTGGKDSRLVLALLHSAGVTDRVEAFTLGPEGSHEVACALEVAKAVGVRHTSATAPAPRPVPNERYWMRLRLHTVRYEGMICPWDGVTEEVSGVRMELNGFGGELYRGSHSHQFRRVPLKSVEDAMARWVNYHQTMDVVHLLRNPFAHFQREWLRAWVAENVRQCRLDCLPEKFYVENRLAHWSGPLTQGVAGRIKLSPLLSPHAARLQFALSPEARCADRLHYEVMKRACPQLLAIPFLNDTWSARIRAENPDLPAEGYETVGTSPKTWQWGFVQGQGAAIAALLDRAERETAIGEIIDVKRTKAAALNASSFTLVTQVKTILSAIGIAHTLLGEGLTPSRDKLIEPKGL